MEICNNLLPTVEEFGKDSPQALNTEPEGFNETPMLESADSDEEHAPSTNGVDADSSKKPSGNQAKASKKSIAA